MLKKLLLVAPPGVTYEDALEIAKIIRQLIRNPRITIRARWHGEKGILIEGEDLAEVLPASLKFKQNGIIGWELQEEQEG